LAERRKRRMAGRRKARAAVTVSKVFVRELETGVE